MFTIAYIPVVDARINCWFEEFFKKRFSARNECRLSARRNERGRADDKSVRGTNNFIHTRRLHLGKQVIFSTMKREEASESNLKLSDRHHSR